MIGPTLKLGAEAFGKVEKAPGEKTAAFLWVGPALSYAHGLHSRMHGFWATVGGGRGLTAESHAWYARAILGFQF